MMLIGCIHAASVRPGVYKADVINIFLGKKRICLPGWRRSSEQV